MQKELEFVVLLSALLFVLGGCSRHKICRITELPKKDPLPAECRTAGAENRTGCKLPYGWRDPQLVSASCRSAKPCDVIASLKSIKDPGSDFECDDTGVGTIDVETASMPVEEVEKRIRHRLDLEYFRYETDTKGNWKLAPKASAPAEAEEKHITPEQLASDLHSAQGVERIAQITESQLWGCYCNISIVNMYRPKLSPLKTAKPFGLKNLCSGLMGNDLCLFPDGSFLRDSWNEGSTEISDLGTWEIAEDRIVTHSGPSNGASDSDRNEYIGIRVIRPARREVFLLDADRLALIRDYRAERESVWDTVLESSYVQTESFPYPYSPPYDHKFQYRKYEMLGEDYESLLEQLNAQKSAARSIDIFVHPPE